MNPEDLGCQRWRPLKKAVEQRTRLVRESNETNERLLALRAELPQAEKADSEAFAAALAAGKPEPERKSEQISAQIENMARRADACSVAIENAENEIRRLRNENGPAWRREQFRTIAKKHAAYEKGIRELEEAREALADEVALAGWIVDGKGISPVNDSLIDRDAAAEGAHRSRSAASCTHCARTPGRSPPTWVSPRYACRGSRSRPTWKRSLAKGSHARKPCNGQDGWNGEVSDAPEAIAAAEVAREEDPERSLGREEDPAPEAAEEVAMLPTTTQRGYGARWQRLSALARRQQPWCSHCGSTVDLVADHVDPATRGMRGITLADIQVLCRRCNGAKQDKPRPKPIAKPRERFSRRTLSGG